MVAKSDWIACEDQLPPHCKTVLTKISDDQGERNEQPLYRNGFCWYLPDTPERTDVWYKPTHWRCLT